MVIGIPRQINIGEDMEGRKPFARSQSIVLIHYNLMELTLKVLRDIACTFTCIRNYKHYFRQASRTHNALRC